MRRDPILATQVPQRIGKLAPIDEPHYDEYDDETEERDRAFAQEKTPIGQVRKAPDEHVLRIARERGHASNIRGGGERH
jgi:hypothetical protein